MNTSTEDLFKAVEADDTQGMRASIDAGADVEARDKWGNSPIHLAFTSETVALLLDRGANVEARNEWGYTPLLLAALRSAENVAPHLEECDQIETVALLLDRGADLNARDSSSGRTALEIAGDTEAGNLIRATEQARSLAATLDAARPPETVPEPPSSIRLSNDPMNRAPREDLGAPDPKPDKPRRVRL